MESITVPDSVTRIRERCFADCDKLTDVSLPDGLISIGGSCFSGCISLMEINIPNTLRSLGDDAYLSKGSVFSGCTSLESVNIPDSVNTLNNYIFSKCTSLKTISIPASITSFGINCFAGCTALDTITSNIIEPFEIEDNNFSDSTYQTATLVVPRGSLESYKSTAAWYKFFNIETDITKTTAAQRPIIETIYDINGIRRSSLEKGMNIIYKTDGTTTKIIKK